MHPDNSTDSTRFTPSLYSMNPDLFAEADHQLTEWEERETGIRAGVPQIINSKIQEEEKIET